MTTHTVSPEVAAKAAALAPGERMVLVVPVKRTPWPDEDTLSFEGPDWYNETRVDEETGEEYPSEKEYFGIYGWDGEWSERAPLGPIGTEVLLRFDDAPCDICAYAECVPICHHVAATVRVVGYEVKTLQAWEPRFYHGSTLRRFKEQVPRAEPAATLCPSCSWTCSPCWGGFPALLPSSHTIA